MIKETGNYAKISSKDLPHIICNNKDENKSVTILKRMCYGEPKNINPLKKLPEPQMRLYGFSGAFNGVFFDTEEQLKEYIENNDITFDDACVIEFLGNVAGCDDVIGEIYSNGSSILYTAYDEYGYKIYNHELSVYTGQFVWEYSHGSIDWMYSAFRDRGITFFNDVYAKIDESNQKVLQIFKEKNLFNMGKK